jgi:hypothetical protein
MVFEKESDSYEKMMLSDRQGAWQNRQDAVVVETGFPKWERVLFHIDEVMNLASVRNLQTIHNRWFRYVISRGRVRSSAASVE